MKHTHVMAIVVVAVMMLSVVGAANLTVAPKANAVDVFTINSDRDPKTNLKVAHIIDLKCTPPWPLRNVPGGHDNEFMISGTVMTLKEKVKDQWVSIYWSHPKEKLTAHPLQPQKTNEKGYFWIKDKAKDRQVTYLARLRDSPKNGYTAAERTVTIYPGKDTLTMHLNAGPLKANQPFTLSGALTDGAGKGVPEKLLIVMSRKTSGNPNSVTGSMSGPKWNLIYNVPMPKTRDDGTFTFTATYKSPTEYKATFADNEHEYQDAASGIVVVHP